jgi:hypothetical protein
LVERNLAKVEVESSRLFSRSKLEKGKQKASLFHSKFGAIAKRLCAGLQIRIAQFDSGSRLQKLHAGVAQLVERNLAKVEVESSRLFSRSIKCTASVCKQEKENLVRVYVDCILQDNARKARPRW